MRWVKVFSIGTQKNHVDDVMFDGGADLDKGTTGIYSVNSFNV